MLAITITLLLCQHLSATWSTRLPLEVYELTSSSSSSSSAAATTTTAHDFENHFQQQHSNLEYATVNAEQQPLQELQEKQNPIKESSTVTITTTTAATTTSVDATTNSQQQLDRRRSRQMLDVTQQQQQQQHHFNHMQHHMHHIHQQQQRLSKDVRILYQIGESEEDLPLCAANAVCSKIDLYETPWIERQCRCPANINNHVSNVIIHHHNDNNNNDNEATTNNKNEDVSRFLQLSVHSNNNHNNQQTLNDKFRYYYEQEKLLQRKHLLVSGDFIGDKRFENLHLKKLMQKLGAVYEDDLDFDSSDFLETNEDSDSHQHHHQDARNLDDPLSENAFPNIRRSDQQQHQPIPAQSNTHMRHSGHGHRIKEISYIGGCPSGLGLDDGHTIVDKTRHYKMCSPIHKLPVCKHFRDYTWTLTMSAEQNVTEQIIHCRCPKNSVTYLTKREPSMDGSGGFAYLFACSPITRIRCQRKQPCKLFTVRKRQEFLDEVNLNVLCQCPKGHYCPSHHTQAGVIPGESFLEDNIQTYSGYCMAND